MTAYVKLADLSAPWQFINWTIKNKCETLEEVIEKCDRGDWLLWLAARLECNRYSIVKSAYEVVCLMALNSDVQLTETETTVLSVVEDWLNGKNIGNTLDVFLSRADDVSDVDVRLNIFKWLAKLLVLPYDSTEYWLSAKFVVYTTSNVLSAHRPLYTLNKAAKIIKDNITFP